MSGDAKGEINGAGVMGTVLVGLHLCALEIQFFVVRFGKKHA